MAPYWPIGQFVQEDAPLGDDVPAGHGAHIIDVVVSE